MLEIGTLVDGKYKVLNKIGQGGMSVVYLAMNEKANKQWAIKEVRKDGIKDFEVVRQGLVAETDILKKLNHPNLPSIIDVIDKDDAMLIVMDYIQGNPLSKQLEETGAQPQEQVIEWAVQICDVLGYLHSRKPPIIYRDMKPANVMLKPDGNITLIDFGTAREYKERNLADTTCLGTIGYAAPEQFGGQGQTDVRTDIYCLGATMYHLVTGCNPSEPPYEIKPIRSINPALSSGLEKIIRKCTQRNPDDRYQSCAELMYALQHYNEIDDLYRKKQKKRLAGFCVTLGLSVVSLVAGLVLLLAADQSNTQRYDGLLAQAANSASVISGSGDFAGYTAVDDYRYDKCLEALALKPQQPEAYAALVNAFKSNEDGGDIVFTAQEEKRLMGAWMQYSKQLEEADPEGYLQLCFDIGKLYWYYYEYSPQQDNQSVRMTSALTWFDQVTQLAPETYEYKEMARIYRDIGSFHKDIARYTAEASDKGMYKDLYVQLEDLMAALSQSDEREIVKLELYRLVINSLENYAQKFRGDGVTEDQLTQLLQTVLDHSEALDTMVGTTGDLKAYILAREENAAQAIRTAYQ